MNFDFLQDATSSLLVIAVIGLAGSVTQTSLQSKDIETIADGMKKIEKELANNYDEEDAEHDSQNVGRELEIIHEQINNSDKRMNERINLLVERVNDLDDNFASKR